jgi:hypothetical protein
LNESRFRSGLKSKSLDRQSPKNYQFSQIFGSECSSPDKYAVPDEDNIQSQISTDIHHSSSYNKNINICHSKHQGRYYNIYKNPNSDEITDLDKSMDGYLSPGENMDKDHKYV